MVSFYFISFGMVRVTGEARYHLEAALNFHAKKNASLIEKLAHLAIK
jgi:hypothetical protein